MIVKLSSKIILSYLFVLIALSSILAYQDSGINQLAFLKPLVGEKCSIHLKNGDIVHGTLWVYGKDYVSLKVKKGLLYSKTEKYAVSEIDYIKDEAANRYYMPKVDKLSNEKPPTQLYITPDNSAKDKDEAELNKEEFQGTFRFLKSDNENKQARTNTEQKEPESVNTKPAVVKTTPPSPTLNPTATPEQVKTLMSESNEKIESTTRTKQSAAAMPVPQKKQPSTGSKVASTSPKSSKKTSSRPVNVEIAGADELEAKQIKILRYQTLVLFGSAVLIAVVLFFFKLTGLKGSTYGKHTLFPSQVVKIDGNYGVIDQGREEGVKVDDILRLYRKSGNEIKYKAKVIVKKVGENYSAVEVVNLKAGDELQVGDVGFRDRNFLMTSLKRLRLILSSGLQALAKGIQYTAKNLEVKADEPAIDLRPPRKEAEKSSKIKVVSSKSKTGTRNRARKKTVTPVQSQNNSKPVGFGLD